MRVISWNINSVRLRINSLKRIVKKFDPDILCLQETKCPKELFPYKYIDIFDITRKRIR